MLRKSGKYGPIDKVKTPSYLSGTTSRALSGGALYVAPISSPKSAMLKAHRAVEQVIALIEARAFPFDVP